jgi:hypothetical protein
MKRQDDKCLSNDIKGWEVKASTLDRKRLCGKEGTDESAEEAPSAGAREGLETEGLDAEVATPSGSGGFCPRRMNKGIIEVTKRPFKQPIKSTAAGYWRGRYKYNQSIGKQTGRLTTDFFRVDFLPSACAPFCKLPVQKEKHEIRFTERTSSPHLPTGRSPPPALPNARATRWLRRSSPQLNNEKKNQNK